MKRSSKLRHSVITWILPLVLFILLIIWFTMSLIKTEAAAKNQQLSAVNQAVLNGAVLCYSIEGTYPENLDYLIDNYKVVYNSDKYIVHYEFFASNIRPNISVIEKGELK